MKIFLLIFTILCSLIAEPNQEVSVFSDEILNGLENDKNQEQNLSVQLEFIQNINSQAVENELNSNNEFIPQNLFVSYKELPQNGYVGEYIPLLVKLISINDFDKVTIDSTDNNKVFLLNEWRQSEENSFESIVYFQASNPLEELPMLEVKTYKNGALRDSANLKPQKLDIVALSDDDGRFINVLAKNLSVKKFKTTKFDDENLILMLELQATEASFENIHFNDVVKQGIDELNGDFKSSTAYYFVIFSNNKRELNFSYFNTQKNDFEIISLPIVIEHDNLSTQIDLNPHKSKFDFYKDIALGVCVLLSLVLFLFYKRYFFALLSLILAAYLFYVKEITIIEIKPNVSIRILPTQNSTIFYVTPTHIQAQELNRTNGYIKVLLSNQQIGWIKKEDVK